jgi:hypothetical protein
MLSSTIFRKGLGSFQSLFRKGKDPTKQLSEGDVELYDVLKSSYGHEDSKKKLESKNYILDKELSSHNQQVYYNPENKKMIYSVTGTHNINDLGTDLMLMGGKLKDTKRFKEAKTTLEKAKEKYDNPYTTVTGHSLGGSIASKLSGDKIISLDKASEIGATTRANEINLRTRGDLVSIFSSGNRNTHTLNHGGRNLLSGNPLDYLAAHKVDNIKKYNFMIG